MAAITANIERPKEITFGASMDKKSSEAAFTGYVKEFRLWKSVRTQF